MFYYKTKKKMKNLFNKLEIPEVNGRKLQDKIKLYRNSERMKKGYISLVASVIAIFLAVLSINDLWRNNVNKLKQNTGLIISTPNDTENNKFTSPPNSVDKNNDYTVSTSSYDIKNKEIIKTVITEYDISVVYNDYKELLNSKYLSNLLYGVIEEIDYVCINSIIYSHLKVRIISNIKGNLEEDDLISVFEIGGLIPATEYINQSGGKNFEEFDDQQIEAGLIESNLFGIPLSKENQNVILFLSHNEEDFLPQGSYSIIGAFMGKYIDQNDNFIRNEPMGEEGEFYNKKEVMYKQDFLKLLFESVK